MGALHLVFSYFNDRTSRNSFSNSQSTILCSVEQLHARRYNKRSLAVSIYLLAFTCVIRLLDKCMPVVDTFTTFPLDCVAFN